MDLVSERGVKDGNKASVTNRGREDCRRHRLGMGKCGDLRSGYIKFEM